MTKSSRGAEYLCRFTVQLGVAPPPGKWAAVVVVPELGVSVLAAVDAEVSTPAGAPASVHGFVDRVVDRFADEMQASVLRGTDDPILYTPAAPYEPVRDSESVISMYTGWGRAILADYRARYVPDPDTPLETVASDLLCDVIHHLHDLDETYDHVEFLHASLRQYEDVRDMPGSDASFGMSLEELSDTYFTEGWSAPDPEDVAFPVLDPAAMGEAEACLTVLWELTWAGERAAFLHEISGGYGHVKAATLDVLSKAMHAHPYQPSPTGTGLVDDLYMTALASGLSISEVLDDRRRELKITGDDLGGVHVLLRSRRWEGQAPSRPERVFLTDHGTRNDPHAWNFPIHGRIVATGQECSVDRWDIARLATPEELHAASTMAQ